MVLAAMILTTALLVVALAVDPTPCTPPETHGPVSLPGVGNSGMANASWSGYAKVSSSTSLFYHISEATENTIGTMASTTTRRGVQEQSPPPLVRCGHIP